MDIRTNSFCSSGMHLPNGSYITLGGNGAVGRGGALGSQPYPGNYSAIWDAEYQDFDGTKAMRILNPCTNSDNFASSQCQWFDDPTVLSMKRSRWYSATEALGDGTVIIIGGFVNGGYINRNTPVIDPVTQGGAAEPTYEYYPPKAANPQTFQLLVQAVGLNAYAHTFLMPSGKLFVQANVSTGMCGIAPCLINPSHPYRLVLWNDVTNVQTPLPDMPHAVVRVYPASGAVAVLPLTPANNYNPTILFCGGTNMTDDQWGNYTYPWIDTWNYPASNDCQRITPEPQDGSAPVYVQDDDMLEGRSMGQFITLPNGKLLVVNGALNGTAGYGQSTLTTSSFSQMPFGESLAAGPVGTPAIYDPNAALGSRWSNAGFSASQIARLYHSSAILLPDASVLIAGSNPNVDVNLTTIYPTTYKAEIFYPPYFSASTRPAPTGMPKTLTYGGSAFDITIPASSYSGSANEAADSATCVIQRGGFTTHAMNMGQRLMQLNNTYTVNADGSIVLHVAQPPPNPNLFQPGPAFMFVNVHGIPSNGSYLILGNGQIGTQPTSPASVLPPSIRLSSASGTGSGSNSTTNSTDSTVGSKSGTRLGVIIGSVVGGTVVLALLGALIGVCLARRRRATARMDPSTDYAMAASGRGAAGAAVVGSRGMRTSDSSAFVPLQQDNHSQAWNASTMSLDAPYKDTSSGRGSIGLSMDRDPYASMPMQPQGYGAGAQQYRY